MINSQLLNERIKRGAAVLDEKLTGWEHNVDCNILDMNYEDRCVVGQADITERNYYDTLRYLFNNQNVSQASIEHGFTLPCDATQEDWDKLSFHWIDFIEERLTCICREPLCFGCDCGSDCAFAPGHKNGTEATTPIEALIETMEYHFGIISDREKDIDESTGMLADDVRQMYATLGWVRRQQKQEEKRPILEEKEEAEEKWEGDEEEEPTPAERIESIECATAILCQEYIQNIFGDSTDVIFEALEIYRDKLGKQLKAQDR